MTVRGRFITLCGRIFREADPAYFPRASFRGRTLYFCTQTCLEAFLADPEAFHRSHRASGANKDKPGCPRSTEDDAGDDQPVIW